MEHSCPNCGAPLPEGASFCPHCAQNIRPRKLVAIPTHLWRKGLKWMLTLAVLIAAGLYLYLRPGNGGMPAGEVVSVVLAEDENGMFDVTAERMREYFPQATHINFRPTTLVSGSIDDYLIDSFQMAALVSSQGDSGSDGEWEPLIPDEAADSRLCLLLFDRNTHLMGYFIGSPTHLGEGQWQLNITLCDYDFTGLYLKQLSAFEEGWQTAFPSHIPPEELESSGAVWFLSGYSTGRGPVLRKDDAQVYHLWTVLHSPEIQRQCRGIQQLEEFLPSEGHWKCFLLLDADCRLLGYTLLDSQGNG